MDVSIGIDGEISHARAHLLFLSIVSCPHPCPPPSPPPSLSFLSLSSLHPGRLASALYRLLLLIYLHPSLTCLSTRPSSSPPGPSRPHCPTLGLTLMGITVTLTSPGITANKGRQGDRRAGTLPPPSYPPQPGRRSPGLRPAAAVQRVAAIPGGRSPVLCVLRNTVLLLIQIRTLHRY